MKKKLLSLILILSLILCGSTQALAAERTAPEIRNFSKVSEVPAPVNSLSVSSDEIVGTQALVGPFTDVYDTDWHADYVYTMYINGIMTGLTPSTFGPAVTLSRAQFVTILFRMTTTTADLTYEAVFRDVPANQFYTDAIMWAWRSGIVTGYTPTTFGTADPITREQLTTILYRWAKAVGLDVDFRISLSSFPDYLKVSPFATLSMEWAVDLGLITGDNGYLNPLTSSSRAVCAALVYRFLEVYGLFAEE